MPAWMLLLSLAHAEDPVTEPLLGASHPPLPGKVVGLLYSTDPALPWGSRYGSTGGRREGGPIVVYRLSVEGALIVPYVEDPLLTGVNPLDDWTAGGTLPHPYDASMFVPGANPFGIDGPAHVVWLEINGGAGAPADAIHVVITDAKVIDHKRGYDLDVTAVLTDLRKRFDADAQAKEAELRAAAAASCEEVKSADAGPGPWSGPDLSSTTHMSVSWHGGALPLKATLGRYLHGTVQGPSDAPPCPPGAPCAELPSLSLRCGAALGAMTEVSKRGDVVQYLVAGQPLGRSAR